MMTLEQKLRLIDKCDDERKSLNLLYRKNALDIYAMQYSNQMLDRIRLEITIEYQKGHQK